VRKSEKKCKKTRNFAKNGEDLVKKREILRKNETGFNRGER
jgi:hypothetical protein